MQLTTTSLFVNTIPCYRWSALKLGSLAFSSLQVFSQRKARTGEEPSSKKASRYQWQLNFTWVQKEASCEKQNLHLCRDIGYSRKGLFSTFCFTKNLFGQDGFLLMQKWGSIGNLTLLPLYFKVTPATVLPAVNVSERWAAFHQFTHSTYLFRDYIFFFLLMFKTLEFPPPSYKREQGKLSVVLNKASLNFNTKSLLHWYFHPQKR